MSKTLSMTKKSRSQQSRKRSFLSGSIFLFCVGGLSFILIYIIGSIVIVGSTLKDKEMLDHLRSHHLRKRNIEIISEKDATFNFGSNIAVSSIRLETVQGDIIIQLRPDLSLESVEYIQRLLNDPNPCETCRFYRAQDRGILQGIMRKPGVAVNTKLGTCPTNVNAFNKKCHGPVMTRGMVGWAGGEAGPDFFIDNYKRDADWWGYQHTVFGVVDASSLDLVESFFDLPRHSDGGMMFLDEAIPFDIKPIESKIVV